MAAKITVSELYDFFAQENLRVEAEGDQTVPFNDTDHYANQVFCYLEGHPPRSEDEVTDYHRIMAERVADYATLSDKDRENLETPDMRDAYWNAVRCLSHLAGILEEADAQSPSSPGPLLNEHLLALSVLDELKQGLLGGFFEPADDRAA
jgi:hypothetical protein